MRRLDSGLTLLELLLVMGLVGMFTVAGGIGLSSLYESFTVRSAGDEIRTLLRQAREYTLSRRESTNYQIRLSNNIITLENVSGVELDRYQAPTDLVFSPNSLLWSFLPITGEPTGCVLPCQLTLSLKGTTEIIEISQSGIIE